MAYLESEASSVNHVRRFMHIQGLDIEQFVQSFSRMFRHIQGYWCIFSHIQRHTTRARGETSPAPLENQQKCPDFIKKGPDCVHLWVNSSMQNVVLRVFKRKISELFPYGAFFLVERPQTIYYMIHIQNSVYYCKFRHVQTYSHPINTYSAILSHI